MKNLAFIFISVVAVAALFLVGGYLLWPSRPRPQPPLVISIDDQIAPLQAQLAQQEADMQAQLDDMLATLQQQQAELDAQTEHWQESVAEAQNQLDALNTQAQELQLLINQLELSRTIRSGEWDREVEEVRQQYDSRLQTLESQLNETRLRLEQTSAQIQN
ncbi:MAG: hypothetical protein Kow0031_00130 [Anaerolineae bacterium]